MAKKVLKKKSYGQFSTVKPGVQPVKRPSQYQPANPMKPISKIGSPKYPGVPKDSMKFPEIGKKPLTPFPKYEVDTLKPMKPGIKKVSTMPVKQPVSAINISDEMKKLVPEDIKKKTAKAKREQRRASLY